MSVSLSLCLSLPLSSFRCHRPAIVFTVDKSTKRWSIDCQARLSTLSMHSISFNCLPLFSDVYLQSVSVIIFCNLKTECGQLMRTVNGIFGWVPSLLLLLMFRFRLLSMWFISVDGNRFFFYLNVFGVFSPQKISLFVLCCNHTHFI